MILENGTNTTYVLQSRDAIMQDAKTNIKSAIALIQALEDTYKATGAESKADGIHNALDLARRAYHQIHNCQLGYYEMRE